jgi:D-serine deaminase-like pyridoxal phosphate-dependent protein
MPEAKSSPLARAIATTYGTPAVVIDLDVVERNIERLQVACDTAGLGNRPHIKTHKSPILASLQRERGAKGITCQKLGEAEVMAAGGLDDILISYNLIGEEKMARLARLLREGVTIRPCADNPVAVDGYAAAARAAERTLGVLIECDTGRERAGVETPGEAIELARRIAGHQGLRFDGLLLYAPENKMPESQAFLDAVQAGLAEHGLEAEIVSTGGTPNLRQLGAITGATEHRSGTSIFNDRMMMACGAATLADCALAVYATVVSRAGADRGILDSGSKTLTADPGGGLDGYGLIREYPKARIKGFAEEHGMLDLAACDRKPEIGETVSIVPNHVCVVVNMVDQLVTVRGDELIGTIPVAARGKIV